MKFNPIGDRVIIKPLDPDEITKGGVILPDIAQEGSSLGEVVSIGPGAWLQNGDRAVMQCEIGDKVYYPKFGAKEIECGDEDYVIIRETEIFTIFGEKNEK